MQSAEAGRFGLNGIAFFHDWTGYVRTSELRTLTGVKQRNVGRLVAVLFVVAGSVYLEKAISYGTGTLKDPGIGFYPAIIGCVWEVAAIMLFVRGSHAVGQSSSDSGDVDNGSFKRVAVVLVGEIGFIEISPIIGMMVPAVLFSILCMIGAGEKRPIPVAVTAAVAGLVTYLLLVEFLGLPRSAVL